VPAAHLIVYAPDQLLIDHTEAEYVDDHVQTINGTLQTQLAST
jgi:hypothetical protein